jgi:Domain of unknown function (DUF4440)
MTQAVAAIESEVRRGWAEWFGAIDDVDGSFFDNRLTESFQMFDYHGNVGNRAEYKLMLDLIEPGYKGVHEFREFNVTVVSATCAIAFGRYFASMKFNDGAENTGLIRFSTTWVLDGDTWKCAFYMGCFDDTEAQA